MWILLLLCIATVVGNPCANRTLNSLPHPSDCQTFIVCWLSKPYLRTCPQNLYYDVQSNNCQPLSATICCNISFQFSPAPTLPPVPGSVNLTTQTTDPKITTPRRNLPPLSTTTHKTPSTTNTLPDVTEEYTPQETTTELSISTAIETGTPPSTDYIFTTDTTNTLPTVTKEYTPQGTTTELLISTTTPETGTYPSTEIIFTTDSATTAEVTKLIEETTIPEITNDWTDLTREPLPPITTKFSTEATTWPTESTYIASTAITSTETTIPTEGLLSTTIDEITTVQALSTTEVDDASTSESTIKPDEMSTLTHTTELPTTNNYPMYTTELTEQSTKCCDITNIVNTQEISTYTPEVTPTNPTTDETYLSTEYTTSRYTMPTILPETTTIFNEPSTTELITIETLSPTTIYPETTEFYTESDVSTTFPTRDALRTLVTSTDSTSSDASTTTPVVISTAESTVTTTSNTEFYRATTDLTSETLATTTPTSSLTFITESTSTSTPVETELPKITIATNTEITEPHTSTSQTESTYFFNTKELDIIATQLTSTTPTTLGDDIDLFTVTELFTIPDTIITNSVDMSSTTLQPIESTTSVTLEYTTEPSKSTIEPLSTVPIITMEPKISTYTPPSPSESTAEFISTTASLESITTIPDLNIETFATPTEELIITNVPTLQSTTEPLITTSTESTVTETELGSTQPLPSIIFTEPTSEIQSSTTTIDKDPITMPTAPTEQQESTIDMKTDVISLSSQETTLVTNPTEMTTFLTDPTISSTLQILPEITIPETTVTISTDFVTPLKPITAATEAAEERSSAETTLESDIYTTLSENVSSPTIHDTPIPSTPLEQISTTSQVTTEDRSSMETTSETATYTTFESISSSTEQSIPYTTSLSEISTIGLAPTTAKITMTTEESPYKVTSTEVPQTTKTLPTLPEEPTELSSTQFTTTEGPLNTITTSTTLTEKEEIASTLTPEPEEITTSLTPESKEVVIPDSVTSQSPNQITTSTYIPTESTFTTLSDQTTEQPIATTTEHTYLTTESSETTNIPSVPIWLEHFVTGSGTASEPYPTTDETTEPETTLTVLTTKETELDITSTTYGTTIEQLTEPTNDSTITPTDGTTHETAVTKKHPLFTLPPLKPIRRPTTKFTKGPSSRLHLPPIPPTESPCEYYEEKTRTTRQPHPLPMCRDSDDFSYPDLGECNFYYRCLNGVMTREKCDDYFAFSPQTLKCLPSSEANCREHYSLTEQQVYLDYFVLFNNLIKKYDEDKNTK